MKRVLVVSPHADDAEISCGGTIARVIAEGGEVCVALMTAGSVKFRHSGDVPTSERIQEFNASMESLGVQYSRVLSFDLDGKMYTAPQSNFVSQLDDFIDSFKPDTILVPLPSSHQDHRYAWEVCLAATRPNISKHQPQLIAAYEYPLSCWYNGGFEAGKGGMYVDVSKYWDKKIEALKQYKTQMRGDQSLISIRSVESLATQRGLESGVDKAELMHVLRLHY
jgi:LmbE family N-acetylglucosaminyl deacetylase